MSNEDKKFYTARGYELLEKDRSILTSSMEDYIEMAYRLSKDKSYTRIGDLAVALNVQPPSVTHMIKKLSEMNIVNYEKYGMVILTDKGLKLGEYFLNRHKTIEKFLSIIGVAENNLHETEKLEHNLSRKTVEGLSLLVDLFENNEQYLAILRQMKSKSNN